MLLYFCLRYSVLLTHSLFLLLSDTGLEVEIKPLKKMSYSTEQMSVLQKYLESCNFYVEKSRQSFVEAILSMTDEDILKPVITISKNDSSIVVSSKSCFVL